MPIKPFNNPGNSSLAISEIRAEFGGDGGDAALSEYYAGGPFVNSGTLGFPNGSPVAIPSSGQIAISNFYGAQKEASAHDCAYYFWIYRDRFTRYNQSGSSWPGDDYAKNDPNSRYSNQVTNSWTYANTDLPKINTNFFTVLSLATGRLSGGIRTGWPILNAGFTLVYDPLKVLWVGDQQERSAAGGEYTFGISYKITWYQGDIRNVNYSALQSDAANANNGTWQAQFLIPGKYTYPDEDVNFGNYSRYVAPGQFSVTLLERGGNGYQPIPYPSGLGPVFRADNWWYNAGGWQIGVNTHPTNPAAMFWPDYNYFVGKNPRVVFNLNRYF